MPYLDFSSSRWSMPVMAAAGAGSAPPLSAASPPITTSCRLPLEPSMMVTVLLSPLGACDADFVACSGFPEPDAGCRLVRRLAQRDTGDRLAAERIVGEKGDGEEGDQEQAEQHGQRLHRREGQPEPALAALRLLSERRAQIVGHFRHGPPRITGADDTTVWPDQGSSGQPRGLGENVGRAFRHRQQKGRPEGRPLFECRQVKPISSRPWSRAFRPLPCRRWRGLRSPST